MSHTSSTPRASLPWSASDSIGLAVWNRFQSIGQASMSDLAVSSRVTAIHDRHQSFVEGLSTRPFGITPRRVHDSRVFRFALRRPLRTFGRFNSDIETSDWPEPGGDDVAGEATISTGVIARRPVLGAGPADRRMDAIRHHYPMSIVTRDLAATTVPASGTVQRDEIPSTAVATFIGTGEVQHVRQPVPSVTASTVPVLATRYPVLSASIRKHSILSPALSPVTLSGTDTLQRGHPILIARETIVPETSAALSGPGPRMGTGPHIIAAAASGVVSAAMTRPSAKADETTIDLTSADPSAGATLVELASEPPLRRPLSPPVIPTTSAGASRSTASMSAAPISATSISAVSGSVGTAFRTISNSSLPARAPRASLSWPIVSSIHLTTATGPILLSSAEGMGWTEASPRTNPTNGPVRPLTIADDAAARTVATRRASTISAPVTQYGVDGPADPRVTMPSELGTRRHHVALATPDTSASRIEFIHREPAEVPHVPGNAINPGLQILAGQSSVKAISGASSQSGGPTEDILPKVSVSALSVSLSRTDTPIAARTTDSFAARFSSAGPMILSRPDRLRSAPTSLARGSSPDTLRLSGSIAAAAPSGGIAKQPDLSLRLAGQRIDGEPPAGPDSSSETTPAHPVSDLRSPVPDHPVAAEHVGRAGAPDLILRATLRQAAQDQANDAFGSSRNRPLAISLSDYRVTILPVANPAHPASAMGVSRPLAGFPISPGASFGSDGTTAAQRFADPAQSDPARILQGHGTSANPTHPASAMGVSPPLAGFATPPGSLFGSDRTMAAHRFADRAQTDPARILQGHETIAKTTHPASAMAVSRPLAGFPTPTDDSSFAADGTIAAHRFADPGWIPPFGPSAGGASLATIQAWPGRFSIQQRANVPSTIPLNFTQIRSSYGALAHPDASEGLPVSRARSESPSQTNERVAHRLARIEVGLPRARDTGTNMQREWTHADRPLTRIERPARVSATHSDTITLAPRQPDPMSLVARQTGPAADGVQSRLEAGLISPAGAAPGQPPTPAQSKAPQTEGPDMDELVEKTWAALMQRFTIEHERRGFGRWS